MTSNLNLKAPEYFHRNYKKDLPELEANSSFAFQAQRVVLVALPFISLYKPFGKTLAIGTSAARTLTCGVELLSAIKKGDTYNIGKSFLNTTLAISSIAGTILFHPLGMLITTGHDLTLNGYHLYQAVVDGNKDKAIQETLQLANNIFYLLTMTHGSLEYQVLSLACQVILGSYSSLNEFKEGNYLESAGHALMAAMRINQAIPQVRALQRKWELDTLLKKMQKQENIAFNKNLPVLCAVGTSSSSNVSILESKSALTEKNQNNESLSEILLKYGNNEYKCSPLHYAVIKKDYNAAILLIENGFSVDSISFFIMGQHNPLQFKPSVAVSPLELIFMKEKDFHTTANKVIKGLTYKLEKQSEYENEDFYELQNLIIAIASRTKHPQRFFQPYGGPNSIMKLMQKLKWYDILKDLISYKKWNGDSPYPLGAIDPFLEIEYKTKREENFLKFCIKINPKFIYDIRAIKQSIKFCIYESICNRSHSTERIETLLNLGGPVMKSMFKKYLNTSDLKNNLFLYVGSFQETKVTSKIVDLLKSLNN